MGAAVFLMEGARGPIPRATAALRLLVLATVASGLGAAGAPAALAQDPVAVERCHRDVVRGVAGIKRGRIAQVGRCLKSLQYDSCLLTDSHTAIHENELRNRVAGPDRHCQAAVGSGASVADFGPAACPPAWDDCDTEVPALNTLDDVAECLVCQERGFDLLIRHELGLPRPAPTDVEERRCMRRLARLVTKAVRKSVIDAGRCAKGGQKPFSCPVDPTPASRFGKALSRLSRNVERCGIDEGRAPGLLAVLCEGGAADAAGLAACLEGLALCLACHTANAALGQGEDCAAVSGFPRCDGAL